MNFNLRGMDQLSAYLGRMVNFDDAREVVKMNGAELQKNMQRQAAVDTGHMKRSITLTINGLTARVTPTAEYASYVEYGTRFMTAQPFVRPSFETQKQQFINDLLRIMRA